MCSVNLEHVCRFTEISGIESHVCTRFERRALKVMLISVVSPATCFCVSFQLRATSAQDRRATITNNKPVG